MSYKTARELIEIFEQKTQTEMSIKYLEFLDSISPSVRNQGILGLIKLGFFTDKIIELLDDVSPSVRKSALKYFKEMGFKGDIKKISSLLEDPEDSIRAAAIDTLYNITSEELNLNKYLFDPSPKVRRTAITVLCDEIDEESLDLLIDDSDRFVKDFALSIKIDRTEDKEVLLEAIENTDNFSIMKKSLLKMMFFDSDFAVEKINSILKDKNLDLKNRKQISQILKDIPLDVSMNIINDVVENTSNDEMIARLMPMYVNLNEESPAKVISTLNSHLDSELSSVKLAAVKGFGSLSEPSTADILRQLLADRDEYIRAASIDALSKMLDYSLSETLEDYFEDHSKIVRKSAVKALGKLKIEDVYGLFVKIISEKKEDDSVRKAAINCAGRLKVADAVFTLQSIIKDNIESYSIRNLAARALLRISVDAVINTLS